MESKKLSCFDCQHRLVCKWTANTLEPGKHPSFISDAHIKPFLEAVAVAYATACSQYLNEEDVVYLITRKATK